MRDVSEKFNSLREAKAQALLYAQPTTILKIKNSQLIKGDALSLARAAGVLAAKRTADLIPYCHPLKVDYVGIDFEFGEDWVKVLTTVKAIDRTGVEMEALTASAIACLTIYDMAKPEDSTLRISDMKLLEKTGGKSDYMQEVSSLNLKAAVVVLSDTVYQGKKEDRAGKKVVEILNKYKIEVVDYSILPDDPVMLKEKIEFLLNKKVNLILTSGGTGLGTKDKTVETIEPMLEVKIPGIMEAARSYGQDRTPYAMLSRGVAGLIKETLVITLPGSSRGAKESMEALFPGVLHIFSVLRKDPHRFGYS
jgi:cyclic pyranopterin monophosphate synthase